MESRSVDTIYRVEFKPRLDTVRVVDYLVDTIEVTNGDATTRVIIRQDTVTNKDTILVTLTQKSDTITTIRDKTVIKYRTRGTKWWVWVLITLGVRRVIIWLIRKIIHRLE